MKQHIGTAMVLLFALLLTCCKSQKPGAAYTSENLKIIPITPNSFIHVSYLETDSYGKVACNGLVYMKNKEAVVFDTPTDDRTSEELIDWITKTKNHRVTAVVVNHFHDDCVGGLQAFHQRKIPSYANERTIELARKEGNQVPQFGFRRRKELLVGQHTVINEHPGEAHTSDNIVSYIPDDEVLFGGCAVKALKATKGYLGDANEAEWGPTIDKIKANYPKVKYVVPGHGDYGGVELLDYTAQLFRTE
ncbi:subclass B1 metallo-beta-lactamase [Pseudozobellia thermophila]|uniref:beta-lactamase n=1 Tax=Pseudozobellia thermophila TaxID=192903 RepID=A0A1M6JMW1_9FLAO|nr:subclass B1 metallo-beta-lactamase [Pseudozobellia thermophila]SHJ48067.1 metallo-beta-lactamase class B [Pseudozobellia thermophila]